MLVLIAAGLTIAVGLWIATFRPHRTLAFLLAAGVLRFGLAGVIPGMNLSAAWLLAMIVIAAIPLARFWAARRKRFSATEWAYMFFMAWCFFELYRGPSLLYAVRVLAKLSFPLLVMLLAQRSVRHWGDVEAAFRWTAIATALGLLVHGGWLFYTAPGIMAAFDDYIWPYAAFTDHSALMAVLMLVFWRLSGQRRYVVLAIALAISNGFHGNRTGIGAMAVGASVWVWLSTRKEFALPCLAGIYIAAAGTLFVWNPDDMFVPGAEVSGREVWLQPTALDLSQINTSGRLDTWTYLLNRFFLPEPLIGAGLGTTQTLFAAAGAGRGGGMGAEHSAYVRLLCDTGVVGCGLFVLAVLSCVTEGFRPGREGRSLLAAQLAIGAAATGCAALFIMGFDTAINCAAPVMQYPFALFGMARAIRWTRVARRFVPGDSLPTKADPLLCSCTRFAVCSTR